MTPRSFVCSHCSRRSRGRRRWCLLWGPVLWRDKKRVRVLVCDACKQMLGTYA